MAVIKFPFHVVRLLVTPSKRDAPAEGNDDSVSRSAGPICRNRNWRFALACYPDTVTENILPIVLTVYQLTGIIRGNVGDYGTLSTIYQANQIILQFRALSRALYLLYVLSGLVDRLPDSWGSHEQYRRLLSRETVPRFDSRARRGLIRPAIGCLETSKIPVRISSSLRLHSAIRVKEFGMGTHAFQRPVRKKCIIAEKTFIGRWIVQKLQN